MRWKRRQSFNSAVTFYLMRIFGERRLSQSGQSFSSIKRCKLPLLVGVDEEGGEVVCVSDKPGFVEEPLVPREL